MSTVTDSRFEFRVSGFEFAALRDNLRVGVKRLRAAQSPDKSSGDGVGRLG